MAERLGPSDALRAALRELAEAEVAEVLSEARAAARARASSLLEDALVAELLRAAERETPANAPAVSGRDRPGRREEPKPPAPSGNALWAYCIIAAAEREAAPLRAQGIEPGSELTAVQEGELVALVSPVPLAEFSDERLREHLNDIEWLERVARAHEHVLEQALEGATVLPLRLCTIYRDEQSVRRMLRDQRPMLDETLTGLRGRREWGVKLFVDEERLVEALEDGASAEAGASASQTTGAEYMARRGRERRASERIDELCDEVAQEVHARLEAAAERARANPPQRPDLHGRQERMLLNGAYLIGRELEQEFGALVDSLRERFGGRGFELELTGPWPPYNFVSPSAMVVS